MGILRASLIVASIVFAMERAGGAQDSRPTRAPNRVDRLETWLAAIERHEPGQVDAPVEEIETWSREVLRQLVLDVSTMVSLVREPNVSLFFEGPALPPSQAGLAANAPRRAETARQISYSINELNRLKTIARGIADSSGPENAILKRGAMLHADIAMLSTPARVPDDGRAGPQLLTVYMVDGRQTRLASEADHLGIGRRLLDKVRTDAARTVAPNPGADETVRLWYVATGAFKESIERHEVAHHARAVELFPKDPEVLFLAACLHEMESGPRVQTVMQAIDAPRDVSFGVGSEGEELRRAEQLFRRSLEANPNQTEARIRLGRVLARRGRHDEAARELRQAVASTENRLLLYYGTMFLGVATEALGRLDEARQAYDRAALLYPKAQSPRLALSALAARMGNRAAALEAIESHLRSPEVDDLDDPWWIYHRAQARNVDALLARLYEHVRQLPRR